MRSVFDGRATPINNTYKMKGKQQLPPKIFVLLIKEMVLYAPGLTAFGGGRTHALYTKN